MKLLANKLNKLRSKIQTEHRHQAYLNYLYALKVKTGRLRGFMSMLMGRIIYAGDYRPLVLGSNIDYHLEQGSAIVLTGESKIDEDSSPLNKIHASATTIGMQSHWNFMNPTIGRPTRIRLRKNAQLVMDTNTAILAGSYIAVWPDQTLRLGKNVCIAQGCFINTRCGLTIGNNVLIAHETTIMDYDGHPVFYSNTPSVNDEADTYGGSAKQIIIEDDVWIGFKATILKGCKIGRGSIIGAGAFVRSDVPPNSIVAGNPAIVVKQGVSWRKY